MKKITKEIKIVTTLVILMLVFLCSFNIVYSYFTSVVFTDANIDFYALNVNMFYSEDSQTVIENQTQLYLSGPLSRNLAISLKSTPTSKTNIESIGIKSTEDSCDAYVRLYLEVYKVKQIGEAVYYIDSNGNYVSETGVYVNELGEEVLKQNLDIGEIIDYAEYFELGYLIGINFFESDLIFRQENEAGGKNFVTYFYTDKLESDGNQSLNISAIRMLSSAPNELLDSDIVIYLTMEAVQAKNNAYKIVFDDNYGYYNWES